MNHSSEPSAQAPASEMSEEKPLSTGPGHRHGFLKVCRATAQIPSDLGMNPRLQLSPAVHFQQVS